MKLAFLTFLLVFAFSFTAVAQAGNERDGGIELYRQGDYEKAAEVLQRCVAAEDADRLAWLYLGASFVKLKRTGDAAKAFQKTNVVYKKNLPIYEKELKIISKPPPVYTQAARRNSVAGNFRVVVEFDANGEIGFVFPIGELSDGLTEKAIDAAKSIKFEPAVKDGKSVTVIKTLEYDFSIH